MTTDTESRSDRGDASISETPDDDVIDDGNDLDEEEMDAELY